jgi:hypothetical protein
VPYTRTLVDGGKGLWKTAVGTVTGEEVLAVSRRDADNVEEVWGLQYGVVDFSATTSLKLTAHHVRQVVEANKRLAMLDPTRRATVAIIAPSDRSFGTAREWHALSEDFGWTSNVFKDRAAAIAWLRDTVPNGDDPAAYPTLNPDPPAAG